jgi:hypothetical protein
MNESIFLVEAGQAGLSVDINPNCMPLTCPANSVVKYRAKSPASSGFEFATRLGISGGACDRGLCAELEA